MPPTPVDLRAAQPGQPEWFLGHLLGKLAGRRLETDRWQAYYESRHPNDFFSPAWAQAFGHGFRRWASNFIIPVVDGMSSRLEVVGFRFKDPAGDADLWAIWQENDLDGASQTAHTDALVKGVSYALVARRDGGGPPLITVESADDCITLDDPRNRRRRLAGLKRWIDDDGHLVAFVYTAERVFKYRSLAAWPNPTTGWPPNPFAVEGSELPAGGFTRLELDTEEWGATHGIGRVPLVPLRNRPDIKGLGKSEVDPVTSHQDQINLYNAAAVVASRYVAIPQRYIGGYKLDQDPDTGQAVAPFRVGADHLVVLPPVPPEQAFDYQIGEWEAADLSAFVRMLESVVWQMAAISAIPYEELLSQPTAIPASGEAKKSSEASLIRKMGQAEIHFGEGWEEVMRVALAAMRDERQSVRDAETLWASTETRNEAVRVDAVVKLHGAGIIDQEGAWDMLDLTPAARERMRARLEKARKEAEAVQPPPLPPAVPEVIPAPTGPRMSPAPTR